MSGNLKPPVGSSAACKGTGTYTCVVGMLLRKIHTPKTLFVVACQGRYLFDIVQRLPAGARAGVAQRRAGSVPLLYMNYLLRPPPAESRARRPALAHWQARARDTFVRPLVLHWTIFKFGEVRSTVVISEL